MTLIVARAAADELRIVGDSRITDRTAIQRGAFVGALRLVVLGPDLAFCFAGDAGRGQQCLQKLAALYKAEEPYEALIETALGVHEDGRGDAQFLIGRLQDGRAELTRIADGAAERGVAAAWIGDEAAHEAYEQALKKSPGDPTATPAMLRAFKRMLADGGEGSVRVDPPCVAIVTLAGGLAYAPTAVLPPSTRGVGGLWTAEGAAYGYRIYLPKRPGVGALGIWFDPGRLGALFYPERRADPIVYRNSSADDFERALALDFAMEVEELTFD